MVETQPLRLSVKSSPFAKCVRPIRKVLEQAKGVKAVGGNYIDELVLIDFDPKAIDVNRIVSIIKTIGYESVHRMD